MEVRMPFCIGVGISFCPGVYERDHMGVGEGERAVGAPY